MEGMMTTPREPGSLNIENTLLYLAREAAILAENVEKHTLERVTRLMGGETCEAIEKTKSVTVAGGVAGEVESLLRDVVSRVRNIEAQVDRI